MKIQIRPYESNDTVAMLDLFYDTVHAINGKDYPPEHLDAWAPANPDFKKKQARFKSGKTIVALLDGKVVGFGNLESDHESLGMLYVHKDHQGQGIGTALLARLEKKLKKKDINLALVEASITAKPFFEKRGYHVVKENRKMLNGIEFLNYIMQKELPAKEEESDVAVNEEKNRMKGKTKESKPFKWKNLLVDKFVDLIIVIVGIIIAVQLNNLKLESDQKTLERFYMESMLGDLRMDQERISQILADLNADKKSLMEYMEKVKDPAYPVDSLGPVLFNILSLETFTPHQNTYQTLVASNGLTAFNDRTIRGEITEYYNNYTSILRFESVYTNLVFRVYSYFSPYADFSEKKILDPTIPLKPESKNFLMISDAQLEQGIEAHTNALQKGSALIKAIENRLRN